MEEKWDDKLFDEWVKLRSAYREAKKQKDYKNVILLCKEIIQLDARAKFINIIVPLFHKGIANGYSKLGDTSNAVKYYELARDGLIKYREEEEQRDPSDWLDDIEKLQKKINRLKDNQK